MTINKLLAISGGPDSMALLYKYRKKNVVVAHVNYNVRKDSYNDESIVKSFCETNNIKIHILSIKDKPKTGNFQDWARKKRYSFFEKIYKKYNCKLLLIAHHNDDFLETAEMQVRSKRTPKYFGIKRKTVVMNMNVKRPFINYYWKNDLLELVKKNNVPFAIDSSNAELHYERNKIRHEMSSWQFREKNNRFKWYKMSNKILLKKWKKVYLLYKSWSKTEFKTTWIENCPYKEELVFEFVHRNSQDIKLSKKKINSIIVFIESPNKNSDYLLNKKYILNKLKNKLKILKNTK